MKRQCAFLIQLGIPFILCGAAGEDPDKIISDQFDDMKIAMMHNMAGALDLLTESKVHRFPEHAKSLLDCALRSKGDNSSKYVEKLVGLLYMDARSAEITDGTVRIPAFRRSATLSLIDVAIMQGNVNNVKTILLLKPDLSACRLLSDSKPQPVATVLDVMIERLKADEPINGQDIKATLDQLQQIRLLVQDHTRNNSVKKRSLSLPILFRKKK